MRVKPRELTAVGLVGAVFAVVLLVAGPALGYAASTGTGEEGGRTLCFAAS